MRGWAAGFSELNRWCPTVQPIVRCRGNRGLFLSRFRNFRGRRAYFGQSVTPAVAVPKGNHSGAPYARLKCGFLQGRLEYDFLRPDNTGGGPAAIGPQFDGDGPKSLDGRVQIGMYVQS